MVCMITSAAFPRVVTIKKLAVSPGVFTYSRNFPVKAYKIGCIEIALVVSNKCREFVDIVGGIRNFNIYFVKIFYAKRIVMIILTKLNLKSPNIP